MSLDELGWHSRGYLPHFDGDEVVQSVTFLLADSLPRKVFVALEAEEDEVARFWTKERELDAGRGACWLRSQRIAELVEDTLLHDGGRRYALCAWVIMPNHVHVLAEVGGGAALSDIVQSWKSVSAHRANRLLERTGKFWYPDYYDRYVRHAGHYESALHYVERNPVVAGLCRRPREWPWGSARLRPPVLPMTGTADAPSA